VFYASLYFKADKQDKRPIIALLAIFAVSVMFWAVFKQNGTALTTWAQYYTDREIPTVIEKPTKALFLAEKVVNKTDSVTQYDQNYKVIKDTADKPLKALGKDVYFRNVDPAKMPPEGKTVQLFNTELFQSVNPFFVVVLTPLVVLFFGLLKRRNREPTTPSKIAWGLIISALSTLVMVAGVQYCSNGAVKASPWWLIASYGVITIGELFLSPMGLSLVSKISPPRLTALMMGGWFLATSIGNKLSGILASLWDKYEHKSNFFLINLALLGAAALIILAMLPWLNRIFRAKMKENDA
jgi:proton-dependent oligopeptide transporter, POT family